MPDLRTGTTRTPADRSAPPYDAVVLAGGPARRLGGVDKAAVRIGDRTLLTRVVAACPDAVRTVVVGPRRAPHATPRAVVYTREEPPGGGPVAALAAGLREVRESLVLLLAADLPFLDPALVAAVTAPPPGADAALAVDSAGRDQPLTAAYRTAPLRRALDGLRAEHGTLHGLPVRRLTARLRLYRVPVATNGPLDCDTWPDIAAARARIGDDGSVLEEWLAAVKAELDIDPEVDTTALLDTAREAAHQVTRPAAPLTTFLLGYAAARHGTDPATAAARVADLAARWSAERGAGSGTPGTASTDGTEPAVPVDGTVRGAEPALADPEGGGR